MKPVKIELENLLPSSSEFKLKQFENQVFKLRPCTGGMLVEISKNVGNVEKMLSMPSAENISKLSLALMEYESAKTFKVQNVKLIDVMTGEEVEKKIGGYELLMHAIQGIKEQFDIYRAILESLGYSSEQANDTVNKLKDGLNKMVNSEINREEEKLDKKDGIKKKKKAKAS